MLMSGLELRSWLELKSGLGLRLGATDFGGSGKGKSVPCSTMLVMIFCQLYKRYLIILVLNIILSITSGLLITECLDFKQN